jgi:hypothetical protein
MDKQTVKEIIAEEMYRTRPLDVRLSAYTVT